MFWSISFYDFYIINKIIGKKYIIVSLKLESELLPTYNLEK